MKAIKKICYFSFFGLIFISISCCDFRIVRDINSFDNCFVQGFFKGIVHFDNFEEAIYYFDVRYIDKNEFENKNGLNVVYDVVRNKYFSFSLYVDLNDNRTYYNFRNLKYDSSLDDRLYKTYIDDNKSFIELWGDNDKILDNHEDVTIYSITIVDVLTFSIGSNEVYIDYRK